MCRQAQEPGSNNVLGKIFRPAGAERSHCMFVSTNLSPLRGRTLSKFPYHILYPDCFDTCPLCCNFHASITIRIMLQRDYLMRLLKDFFEALTELLGKTKTSTAQEFEKKIETLYKTYFQHNRAFFLQADAETITREVMTGDLQNALAKSEMLAALLALDADHCTQAERRFDLYQKALLCYEFVEQHSTVYDEARLRKMDEIRANYLMNK